MKVLEHYSSPEKPPTPELVMCSPYYEEGKKSSIWRGGGGISRNLMPRPRPRIWVLEVFPTGLWDAFFLYTGLHSLRNIRQGLEDYRESCNH